MCKVNQNILKAMTKKEVSFSRKDYFGARTHQECDVCGVRLADRIAHRWNLLMAPEESVLRSLVPILRSPEVVTSLTCEKCSPLVIQQIEYGHRNSNV